MLLALAMLLTLAMVLAHAISLPHAVQLTLFTNSIQTKTIHYCTTCTVPLNLKFTIECEGLASILRVIYECVCYLRVRFARHASKKCVNQDCEKDSGYEYDYVCEYDCVCESCCECLCGGVLLRMQQNVIYTCSYTIGYTL